MSAKNWLMAGLRSQFRAAHTCGSSTNDPQDDARGRVAVTTDGDAGLWWLPVADTNGKKKHRGSVRAQLVQHAARPDERRQLHGERVVRLDRAAGHLRRVGLHPARRPRQPAVVQHRSGTRRRRSPQRRMRTNAGRATRSATSASARKYAFLSEGAGRSVQPRRPRLHQPADRRCRRGRGPGRRRGGSSAASSASGSTARSC